MFYNNCGVQIPDNSVICPNCNAQLSSSIGQSQPIYTAPATQPATEPKEPKKEKNPKGKGYAAIVSALLAFPALLCLVIDYIGAPEFIQKWFPDAQWLQTGDITWSAYMLGILMCLWMAVVLPVMKPKRPAVTACICLAVISVYLLLLSYVNHSAGWYVEFVLPVCLMLTVSSAIMTILVSYKVIKKGHIASAIGVQLALLGIGTEILFDVNLTQQINLRWSLVFAVSAVGLILIYEAVRYATRINKK
ncbi:MAG: zinc ribbon domain-containing protein [Clostridia bacterium]|nr:zinc ribbon domain-containing protein [Clostridia bacterium]